ncbi:MAG: FAD-dependent oxidoreductase [Pseudomonadales bacterium]
MAAVGTPENPLRVAIIGSGPSGFYTVSNLLKQSDLSVEMDMFDRLPTPYGLVRAGVAPDHQKDKSVTRAYEKSAAHPGFRFFGNVEYGTHIHMDDLKAHYHQVMFTTGSPFDRNLGIPGEDLEGSHSATEFVAWYNGHPDFADLKFDLTQENVAVVGMGNVAMDVARILCKTTEELAVTDIAEHALEALKASQVKNVYILGRRGPAQAAFTPPEIKEMGEFEDADVVVLGSEAALDAASQQALEASGDKNAQKNVDTVQEYASRSLTGKKRQLHIRFLVSPSELEGQDGRVTACKLVKNKLVEEGGSIKAVATSEEEVIPAGLVFRSVGYRGKPLPDVPFNDSWGTIANEGGRVVDESGAQAVGLYTAGWIKRGPSGVIGTNKTCAQETVNLMVEDLAAGRHFEPTQSPAALADLVLSRQPDAITFAEWKKIDDEEVARGEAKGKPRVKFTRVAEMVAVARS